MVPMPSAAVALLAELSDAALDALAERLAPRLQRHEDRWLRGAEAIARHIDAVPSRVYALAAAGRIPVHHDGSYLVAATWELDKWIRDEGGGKRP
jgi:DNA-binding IclR family transcriptional regulator